MNNEGKRASEAKKPPNQAIDPAGEDQLQQDTAETAPTDSEAVTEPIDEQQTTSMPELQAQLEEALAQVDAFKDQALRSTAEMENVRRRAEMELRNARKFAVEQFAQELLGVKDSLDIARTVDLKGDNKELLETMLEGLELTTKQLEQVLDKFSIKTIDPEPGDKFDPDWHQAMTMQESEEVPSNHIVTVIQKGYALHDRLLRPAMVVVASSKSEENT